MATFEKVSAQLSAKQIKAIEALLKEQKTEAAAALAGVSVTTLWRWLQLPEFSAAYRGARNRILEGTLTALQSASSEAVTTLRDVLTDKTARPGEKVSAARTILEFSLRAKEVLEVEQRIAELEARLAVDSTDSKGKVKQWG